MEGVTRMPQKPSDKAVEEIKEFLELVLFEGEDVVNEWELEFVRSILDKIARIRLLDKQKEVLFQIKRKMVKEGLCDEDDYAEI